jgi:hypothetical protein
VQAVLAPLRDRRGRAVVTYQVAWNAAVGFVGSLFAMHLLSNLHLRVAAVALHGALFALVRTLATGLWGRAIDRVGARPVLQVCSFGTAGLPLLWLLIRPDHVVLPLLLDIVFSGVLWAGHGLASFALPMAVAPQEGRPHHLAVYAAAGGVAFAVAAAVGGFAACALPVRVSFGGVRGYGMEVLFAISAVARLGAASLSRNIEEPGARPVRELFALAGAALGRPFGAARDPG